MACEKLKRRYKASNKKAVTQNKYLNIAVFSWNRIAQLHVNVCTNDTTKTFTHDNTQ